MTAAEFIASKTPLRPKVAVVLGSGLGAFADSLQAATVVPYTEIPGWPASTAIGHAGKLVVGTIDGVEVAALAGRAHLYEGYTARQAVYGVRALRALGVESLILTNAAGGIKRVSDPARSSCSPITSISWARTRSPVQTTIRSGPDSPI